MPKQFLGVIMLFALLAGCASTPQLSSQDRMRFGAARIDPTVSTPSEMYYLGTFVPFGAVGGVITVEINQTPGERLDKFAKDNGVYIDRIVREEAARAFQQSGKLMLTDADGPNVATMKISITQYGFSIPTGFDTDLVPIVSIKCILVDPSGKTIWSANDATRPLGNPVTPTAPAAFNADPKLVEASWRAAAKSLMANIVGHM